MAVEKPVRDRLDISIPQEEIRIERDPARLDRLLREKLDEELRELEASAFRDAGEFADVIEVLHAIARRAGLSPSDIERARAAKLEERGGFERGLVWTGAPRPGSDAADAAAAPAARSLGIAVPPAGEIHVYADGACSGNPGPGGWGAVLVGADGAVRDLGGADPATTNNRMELSAAIEGLAAAAEGSPVRVVMHLDSTYVKDGITGWIRGWKRNGWRTAAGSPVKNRELWQALDAAVAAARDKGVDVEFRWVKGHAGHPGNERADAVARSGIAGLRR